MKTRSIILSLLIIVSFAYSCKNNLKKNAGILLVQNETLIAPVKAGFSQNKLVLTDFIDPKLLDSVSHASYLKMQRIADTLVFSYDKSQMNVYEEIHLWSKNNVKTILLERSTKVKYTFSFDNQNIDYQSVYFMSDFNNWNPVATPLSNNDSIWTTEIEIHPGKYHYLMVLDGKQVLDENNPIKEDNNLGGFNSVLIINKEPMSSKISTLSYSSDTVRFKIEGEVEHIYPFINNYLIENYNRNGEIFELIIPAEASEVKRSFLRIFASNNENKTNDLLIPLEYGNVVSNVSELTRNDKEAEILYFLMVDRFKNGDTGNDDPIIDDELHDKANYYGGDLAGVKQLLEKNFFNELGVSGVWLSPIVQNPLTSWGQWQDPKTKFSGYHGYWPISSTKIDHRFGNAEELTNLIDVAHSKDLNIILDYVANHVHIEHPIYQNNPEWATSLYLPDSTKNTQKWDEHRLTTWFDDHLPTLNLQDKEIAEAMTDSALFWLENYDIDGLRHDATKHIPEDFWRLLTRKINKKAANNKRFYQIGETFGGRELIQSYVGPGLLSAQFDFGLYFDARNVFSKNTVPFSVLVNSLNSSFETFGNHSVMGNISGNHDMARFISYASGALRSDEDAKMAGWKRDIQVTDRIGYDRLKMLHAFNLTIPGIPIIYYGDEYGMPGAGDPDNRRMMQFEDLSQDETNTLGITTRLIHTRKNHLALIYGSTEIYLAEEDVLSYGRTYFDQFALIVMNRSSETKEIIVPVFEENVYQDFRPNVGNNYEWVSNGLMIKLKPYSFEVLTTETK